MDEYSKLIRENSRSLRVLYVEDDDDLRISTLQLLGYYFEYIDYATDGEQGLRQYSFLQENFNETYDIVIADIQMPKMNGIQMCEKIIENNPNQPIIFITAFNNPEYLAKAISIGVESYISKPMQLDEFKKVLYKVTQKINENKLLKKYYEELDEKAALLITKKNAVSFKSAQDILTDLEDSKEWLCKLWINNRVVLDVLKENKIDTEFFRDNYALNIIDYFLGVIKKKNEIGDCPVVFKMLEFFKENQVPLNDIFMICVEFKNSVFEFIFEKYTFNKKLFRDLSTILDRNFEGVIKNYVEQHYHLKAQRQDAIQVSVQNDQKNLQSKEHVKYSEYVLEHDIYILQDLEEDIDTTAIAITESNKSTLSDYVSLGEQIKRYGEILLNYPLFHDLGGYIVKLGENLEINAQLLFEDRERMLNIAALIEAFINDLIVWRHEIFENNIEDPHFLDKSFFSNVDTIIMFVEYNETANDVNDDDLDDLFF